MVGVKALCTHPELSAAENTSNNACPVPLILVSISHGGVRDAGFCRYFVANFCNAHAASRNLSHSRVLWGEFVPVCVNDLM